MATQNPSTEPQRETGKNMPRREEGQKEFGTGSNRDAEINPSRTNRDEVNLDKNNIDKSNPGQGSDKIRH